MAPDAPLPPAKMGHFHFRENGHLRVSQNLLLHHVLCCFAQTRNGTIITSSPACFSRRICAMKHHSVCRQSCTRCSHLPHASPFYLRRLGMAAAGANCCRTRTSKRLGPKLPGGTWGSDSSSYPSKGSTWPCVWEEPSRDGHFNRSRRAVMMDNSTLTTTCHATT